MKYSYNERGYTMIEAVMYIGILIILGGVLAGYAHKAMERYKTGRAVQQIVDLKKAVLHFTAADEDYSNVSIEKMQKSRSLPPDMRSGDQTRALHALGGTVEIGPVSEAPLNADDDNKYHMFFIRFNHLSKEACIEILTQGQFYGDGSEMDTLIVHGKLYHAWHFPHSFYDTTKFGSGEISDDVLEEFPARCLQSNQSDASDCVKRETTRLTISDALKACTKEDNSIIWVFS